MVLPLHGDALHIAESPGGGGWGLTSISWWLPWEGISPASLITCSSLSQLINRKLHALPGRCTPDFSDVSGRHCYQNLVMSLRSPHILLLLCPPARLCVQGTCCLLWRFEKCVQLSVLPASHRQQDGNPHRWPRLTLNPSPKQSCTPSPGLGLRPTGRGGA